MFFWDGAGYLIGSGTGAAWTYGDVLHLADVTVTGPTLTGATVTVPTLTDVEME